MHDTGGLEAYVKRLETECAQLREENARLRAQLSCPLPSGEVPMAPVVTLQSPASAKVALFRSFFRGRDDVYAARWAAKEGKSGYSPACRNEWVAGICKKPCATCTNRDYLPLTDQVIEDHLTGKHTIGVYPLLADETCWLLAADFDKAAWQEDVAAFLDTCEEMGVPAVLERSRSSNGAHVWVFFDRAIPATQARNLGSAILTRTMQHRHQIGLDSYDRLFPNQDTMPRGGLGNLIALPLQREPRDLGNTLFLDRSFHPYPDQWSFLSQVRKMRAEEVDNLVQEATRHDRVIGVQMALTDDDGDDDPWTLPPSGRRPGKPVPGPFPENVRVVRSNLVYVEKAGLAPAMLNQLIRLAAFQNPEFYQAQRMRLPTFGKPRVIGCAEDFSHHIGLPRGCHAELLGLLQDHGIRVEVEDQRYSGNWLDATFQGELTPAQLEAAQALLAKDHGILSATTGFGKTVIAAWLIAARGVNTLVLVHRRQLMDQWRERLITFLDLPPRSIGQIGGGKVKPTGLLDIGIIQSLNHGGQVKDVIADYGQVIVDECHHLPAFSFEQVLKQAKARYVVGLTATPVRKDGHHPIITMQCGPIRFRVDPKQQAAISPFEHVVIPRETEFVVPLQATELGIQEVYALLASDHRRNEMIAADILAALQDGRSPLVLTDRKHHMDDLAARLHGAVGHVILLRGGMGAKERRAAAERLAAVPQGEERVIIATGRYIGEGFDDARLDTLFLTMPISWRGTLQQYAGRLHRLHAQKRVVQVYDYVDARVPMLMRMYEKRLKGYEAIGYRIGPAGGGRTISHQARLW